MFRSLGSLLALFMIMGWGAASDGSHQRLTGFSASHSAGERSIEAAFDSSLHVPKQAVTDETQVSSYVLPDPLVTSAGQPVQDGATWRNQRRNELLELFSREIYGRTPPGRPSGMHWTVASIDRAALGGKAVRKEVTIWFTEKADGPQMHLLLYQPAVAGPHAPWPAFLGLNFYGNVCMNSDPGITLPTAWMKENVEHHIVDNRATEATRGTEASRWQVEKVLARGYATAAVYYGDLCPDEVTGLPRGVGALFGTPNADARRPDEWGAIGMWAWGLSRALDYLQSDPEIDGQHVAVHGHSRLGKAALWAAAQDERFALVISNCSGCGGAALDKRIFGETVALINTRFPHWFSRNFRHYDDNEAALPVDQHELLALIAPRPLYVASASEDIWADPRGEFLSLMAAQPVYRLLGRRGLDSSDLPRADSPLKGDGVGYHLRAGKHDITAYDWDQYLEFADRYLQLADPK